MDFERARETGRYMRACSFLTPINMPRRLHERGIGSNSSCDS